MTHQPIALFDHVPTYGGDPILSLMEDFQKDGRAGKVSLSIGLYFDEAGCIPVMGAVRQAEATVLQHPGPKPYLPMEGAGPYRLAVQSLVFGADHPALRAGHIATVQTPGGSGALKVGADFLKRYFGNSQVWVCDPTWENHVALFEGAGFTVNTYPYYDPSTKALRFEAMLAALKTLPRRSIVLLHASCHNPTGVDLSNAQWAALVPVLQAGELIPFVDMAYQGFGDGLDEDAYAVRALASAGVQCFIANSFSKNFSLYGERCGGLSVLTLSPSQADTVLGQLKATIRRIYSSPPTHGSRLITEVLQTPALYAQWADELGQMRGRMKDMRIRLHAHLTALCAQRPDAPDFSYLLTQRGMFSYTGLSETQVQRLRDEHAVYLVRSGRLCVSGLTQANVESVAHAMVAVLA